MKKKVCLAAGGTGGHVFPAMCIGNILKEKHEYQIHIITDEKGIKYCDKSFTLKKINIHINKSSSIKLAYSAILMLKACFQALCYLYKIKPNIIIGFGSYHSFPTLFAGFILNIPIILHEQNTFFSTTNQLFARFAKYILLSYEKTYNINYHKWSDKIYLTGMLVRDEIKNITYKKSSNQNKFQLLIIGGSQGANFFTNLVIEAVRLLVNHNKHINFTIIQQAPIKDHSYINNIYKELSIHQYKVSNFFSNMHEIYKNTDIIISRSGASTIGELIYTCIPSILIPLPSAKNNHQYFNALELQNHGGCICYKQNNISSNILFQKIHYLISNREELKHMSQKLKDYKKKTNIDIYNTVKKIIS